MFIHSGLINRYFKSLADFNSYLQNINMKYDLENMTNLMNCLYRGYGIFQTD
jgi:hypothetical protein